MPTPKHQEISIQPPRYQQVSMPSTKHQEISNPTIKYKEISMPQTKSPKTINFLLGKYMHKSLKVENYN
jgi:hypothetical protein